MNFIEVSNSAIVNVDAYAEFRLFGNCYGEQKAEAFLPVCGNWETLSYECGNRLKEYLVRNPKDKWVFMRDGDTQAIINLQMITSMTLDDDGEYWHVNYGDHLAFGYVGDDNDLGFDEEDTVISWRDTEIESSSFAEILRVLHPIKVFDSETEVSEPRDTRW